MLVITDFRPDSIRELREASGLSVPKFLIKAGISVSRQAVSRWETGVDVPNARMLVRIANAFQVPINHFFSMNLSSNDNGIGH